MGPRFRGGDAPEDLRSLGWAAGPWPLGAMLAQSAGIGVN